MKEVYCVLWIFCDYDFPGEFAKFCDHDYCHGRNRVQE